MKKSNFQKGFTLVELLVAMSLFVIFSAIASGGFIRTLRTQRAMVALMAVNDNTSLVLEQIAREMRTGYNFCTYSKDIVSISNENIPECRNLAHSGNDDKEIMFTNINSDVVSYRLNNNVIERGSSDVSLIWNYKKITADNIRINDFKIILFGNRADDDYPPRITISLSASPTGNITYLQNIHTDIQTTISSRSLES